MTKLFVMVAGPGRCGSSAIAGALHQSGVDMGPDLIGPDQFMLNPWGHFESRSWHSLERRLCRALQKRRDIDVPAAFSVEWIKHEQPGDTVGGIQMLMAQYLDRRYAMTPGNIFGIKSTLWGLIFPIVAPMFPDGDWIAVCVHRNWSDSVRSRRNHLSKTNGVPLNNISLGHAERVQSTGIFSSGIVGMKFQYSGAYDCVHVDFDRVKSDPGPEMGKMFDRFEKWTTDVGVSVAFDRIAATEWIHSPLE